MENWYNLDLNEVYQKLSSSASGLKKDQIAGIRQKSGPNTLTRAKQKSKLAIFISQFKDTMILILSIAAVISFFVGELTDGIVILAIIFGNAIVGYIQENNAEESVRMLQKMAAQFARVVRNNYPEKIEASELVPGDIILLEAGDVVPADARLIEIHSLKTEEAALTGESATIEKTTEKLEGRDLIPGDQKNMVFKGTLVSNGSAKAIVTNTGMSTQIGKIAGMLDVEDQKTPLQKRLSRFSKQLTVIVIIISLIVFGVGLWRGEPVMLIFLTALSLAVAALPEALPAVITIALAKGAKRMVKQKALIRNLPAVETLGSVTYICSDKTGTLTRNVMTVEKTMAAEGKDDLLIHCMLLNNEIKLSEDGEIAGDSTEIALFNHALKKNFSKTDSEAKFPFVTKFPFDSDRMKMSTLHRQDNKYILLTKGAPAKIAESLSLKYKDQKEQLLLQNREWAGMGLRVLFFGYRIFDQEPEVKTPELETELDFLGIAAMIDPPREEVVEAISECKTAGIKPVMITGDQELTANAIAERLNMRDDTSKMTMTGAELKKISEEEFREKVEHITVYARVSPEQKLNIVKALQEKHQFVSMTGDGVNDAPSLKQADIGVAMGITGTDVSKEAADMILLDDNFATIVKAIKEGRRIYENIRKFILYVLSCNLAEILTILLAPLLGLALPLLPIQILWINLVTDGLPGLALTSEPAEKDIMKRPPRPPGENLFAGGMIPQIIFTGALLATAVLLTQKWAAKNGYDHRTQQTMVFTLLCFMQLGNALSVRSVYHSILSSDFFKNTGMLITIGISIILQLLIVYLPALHPIFNTLSLDWKSMQMILLVTALGVMAIELIKVVRRKIFI